MRENLNSGFLLAEQCGEKSMFSHAVFLCWLWLEKIQTLHSKFMVKLNCGNLLTPHRVYSEFFFNLNPILQAVIRKPLQSRTRNVLSDCLHPPTQTQSPLCFNVKWKAFPCNHWPLVSSPWQDLGTRHVPRGFLWVQGSQWRSLWVQRVFAKSKRQCSMEEKGDSGIESRSKRIQD